MSKERVNIYTIAKEAGVSPATVSRVMTSNANVSREKKERVEAVIQKYNYMPNALAQGLSTSRTHTIGMMIADISNPFYAKVAEECERAANRMGYMLLMLSSLGNYELEKRQLVKLYEQRVDAILIVGGRIDHLTAEEEYTELINRFMETTPIVSTGKLPGAENLQVRIDESRCMDLAMEHLIGLGHKKIALVGGREEAKSTFEKRERYRIMLSQHGIAYCEDYVLESTDYANESGYLCMKQLLKYPERPTAVIAINDYTATGIIRAIREAGLEIPEDISLVAFDNTYLSEIVTPKITSIGCDYREFGQMLVETAVRASENETAVPVQVAPVSIIQRDSCKKIDDNSSGKGNI